MLMASAAGALVLIVPCFFCPALHAQTADEPPPAEQKAEEAPPPAPTEERSRKTYTIQSGTTSLARVEESERKVTADGEVEIQRVRVPSWSGDHRVLLEREVRTRKLPDGTVEKEYVLKNPDGWNRLVPIEIIREKITKEGDSEQIEREVLKPDFSGGWRSTRKERVTESGPQEARRSIREVREPTATGEWKTVERQTTEEKVAEAGKESRSVRQLPDAYGRLADYEVRQERVSTRQGQERREVTLRRRDFHNTHEPEFYLVERTVSDRSESADGKVTVKSTTESDLLDGGATRNVAAGRPVVVEESFEEETRGEDGTTKSVVNVKERGAADPSLRPSYQVIQSTDRDGHVRQIFIPLR